MCGLYPGAMTEETAYQVSVNTVHTETQQPQNLINKQGLCNKGGNCPAEGQIEGANNLDNTCVVTVECTRISDAISLGGKSCISQL